LEGNEAAILAMTERGNDPFQRPDFPEFFENESKKEFAMAKN